MSSRFSKEPLSEIEEKKLRQEIADNLGIDLCSEEELATEQKVAETEIIEAKAEKQEIKSEDIPKGKQLSVNDLIMQCNRACQRMSNKNPHKFLLYLCASALRQLVDRLQKYESKVH